MEELLSGASKRAICYLESLGECRVFPSLEARQRLVELEVDFPLFAPKDLSDENLSR